MSNLQPIGELDYDDLEQHEGMEVIQLVGLKLGEEEYAIDVLKIQEIIRTVEITSVPRTDSFVLGVMNLRGKVIPVIDLRIRFSLDKMDFDKETRIIVVRFETENIGFVVDEVTEVIRINKSMVEPTPPLVGSVGQEYILGICKYAERLIILLDIDSVVNDDKTLESDLKKTILGQMALPSAEQNYQEIASNVEQEYAEPEASEPAAITAEESVVEEGSADDEVGASIDDLIALELSKREAETDELNAKKKEESSDNEDSKKKSEPVEDAGGDLDDILNDALNQCGSQMESDDGHVEQLELDDLIALELAKREAETDELNKKKTVTNETAEESVEKPQPELSPQPAEEEAAIIEETSEIKEPQEEAVTEEPEETLETNETEEDTIDNEVVLDDIEDVSEEIELDDELEDIELPDEISSELDDAVASFEEDDILPEETPEPDAIIEDEISLDDIELDDSIDDISVEELQIEEVDDLHDEPTSPIDRLVAEAEELIDEEATDTVEEIVDEVEEVTEEDEPAAEIEENIEDILPETEEEVADEPADPIEDIVEEADEEDPMADLKAMSAESTESADESFDKLKTLSKRIIDGEAIDLGIDIKGEITELLKLIKDTKERVDEIEPVLATSNEQIPSVLNTLASVTESTEDATLSLMENADGLNNYYQEFIGEISDLEDLIYRKDVAAIVKKIEQLENDINNTDKMGYNILHALEFQDITEQKLNKVIGSVSDIGARLGAILGFIKLKQEQDPTSVDDASQDDIDKLLADFGLD